MPYGHLDGSHAKVLYAVVALQNRRPHGATQAAIVECTGLSRFKVSRCIQYLKTLSYVLEVPVRNPSSRKVYEVLVPGVVSIRDTAILLLALIEVTENVEVTDSVEPYVVLGDFARHLVESKRLSRFTEEDVKEKIQALEKIDYLTTVTPNHIRPGLRAKLESTYLNLLADTPDPMDLKEMALE